MRSYCRKMEKRLIIFIDSGDTLVDESTEIRKIPGGVVYEAEFVDGALETLRQLKEKGYRIALVADGLQESFERVYGKDFLKNDFEALAISEIVGEEKPSAKMFMTAMKKMGLQETDKNRILMVGNNLKRDILGANHFGIQSALMKWSPRYSMVPEMKDETPDYYVDNPLELLILAETLEEELRKQESRDDKEDNSCF